MNRDGKTTIVSSVREMRESDLPEVRSLAEQLGYPVALYDLSRRFHELTHADGHQLLVACSEEDGVIGWIHIGREMSSLLTDQRAAIGALVVDSRCRSRGVGTLLLKAAERWAASRNLKLVRVRSNVKRSDAHRFYQRQGFRLVKSWHLFTKELAPDSFSPR